MRTALVLLTAALLAAGCAPRNFTKDGASAEQYSKDESQCRSQARTVAQNDRAIEDQRRSVFSGERDRFGQQDLYKTMDNQGYEHNYDRLLARCMEGRGWAPKKSGPISMPKLSW